MRLVLTGNYAVAYAVKLCKPHVIAAYPITPQTSIVEKLAEFVEKGELKAKYIRVESEHSAMAAVIGAASVGARVFTATSSQGLLYMHEGLWMASGARLPIVMAVVTRAIFPPWSIWTDHADLLDQRDTGWLISMAENNQEAYDLIIQAYRIAEDENVLLPIIVGLDAFIVSHTAMPVQLLDEKIVEEYLPPRGEKPYVLDVNNPITMGNIMLPDYYMEFRYMIHKAMMRAKEVIREATKEFYKLTGRNYGGLVDSYRCDDAEIVVVLIGALAGDAKECVDQLREEGYKVGVLRLRFIRPFPSDEVKEILSNKKAVIVIDRDISFGKGGILYTEILSELYNNLKKIPPVRGYIAGLGGRDVSVKDIRKMILKVYEELEKGELVTGYEWYGLKKEVIP